MKHTDKSRLAERSVYSLENAVLGFILRDTETGKYLVESPTDINETESYKSDSWWSDTVDFANVFESDDEAFDTLDDVASDFAEGGDREDFIERFEVNAIYPEKIWVKDAPLSRSPFRESFYDPAYNDPNKPEKHTFHVEDIVWEGRRKNPKETNITLNMTHLYYTGDVYDMLKDKLCTKYNCDVEEFMISEEDFEFLGSLGWKVLGFF